MNGRAGTERTGGEVAEVDVLYARANERVAKAVALLGTYLIWGMLGMLLLGALVLAR